MEMRYVEEMGLTSQIVNDPMFQKGFLAAFAHLQEQVEEVSLECNADGNVALWSEGEEIGWVNPNEATLWDVIALLD